MIEKMAGRVQEENVRVRIKKEPAVRTELMAVKGGVKHDCWSEVQ